METSDIIRILLIATGIAVVTHLIDKRKIKNNGSKDVHESSKNVLLPPVIDSVLLRIQTVLLTVIILLHFITAETTLLGLRQSFFDTLFVILIFSISITAFYTFFKRRSR